MKNRNRLESPTPANQCGSPTTANSLQLSNSNGSSNANTTNSANSNNNNTGSIPNNSGAANGAINNSITTGNGSGNVNDDDSGSGSGSGSSSGLIVDGGNTHMVGGTLILTAAMQHHKSNVHNSPPSCYNNNNNNNSSSSSNNTANINGHQLYPSISSTYWLPPPNPAPYLVPERKLFVGMLNKKYNEADVRQLFAGHGTIEECTVLRDQNGQSKGCAFVTFATKHNAIGAIKALHQSRTMEGCSAPLVVKFADTQKEKDQKKMQQLQASLVGITALTTPATGSIAGLGATPTNGLSPATGATLVPSPLSAASVRSNSSMSAALAAVAAAPQATAVANPASALVPTSAAISVSPTLLTAAGTAPQQASPYLTTTDAINASAAQLQLFQQLQAFGLHPAQYLQGPGGESLTSHYAPTLSPLSNGAAFATTTSPLTTAALQAAAAGVAGKQVEGPDGSNLFIYHLPQEFTDTDLASTFLPFGSVLSAKVFIDKQTNLSKCFGFVSYDNPLSASAAIQAMHGFQIGTKRLKVQLKRSKDAAKPY